MPTSTWARGFSYPGETLDTSMLEAIVAEHGRQMLQRFLAKYEAPLAAGTSGLVPSLTRWAGGSGEFGAAWDPSFGDCAHAVVADSKSDPVAIAAAMGLRLSPARGRWEWEARFRAPLRLRMGHSLLPLADALNVERRVGPGLVVQTRVGRSRRSLRFSGGLPQRRVAGVEVLPSVRAGRQRIDLLARSALDGPTFEEELPRSFESVGQEIVGDLQAALQVLRRHAPTYLLWVSRVLRGILPQHRSSPELLESGSSNRRPGLVFMTFPVAPAPCGELLVHECTHQYLYLLERMGRVDNGEDNSLYYSPIKRCDRPIRAILLAFHAFANVLLYYRMCRSSGLEDGGYCERQEEQLLPQLKDLLGPLRRTKGLTPAGRSLWEPLAAAIAA